jgi:ribosome recycling factor
MLDDLYREVSGKMEKSFEAMKREFSTVRTGRASAHVLDSVRVEYYGSQMALNQVSNVSVPDARLIEIKPFDKGVLPEIEKAIQKANLGLVPQSDGKVVRIAFPPLSEERRKELVKVVHKMGEEGRVAVRNIRREANETVREFEQGKLLSQDEASAAVQHIQKATDQAIARIEGALGDKEKEVLQV